MGTVEVDLGQHPLHKHQKDTGNLHGAGCHSACLQLPAFLGDSPGCGLNLTYAHIIWKVTQAGDYSYLSCKLQVP